MKTKLLKIFTVYIVCVTTLFCWSHQSLGLTAKEAHQLIDEKFSNINTYRAEFTLSTTEKEQKTVNEGIVFFKKPNMLRTETNLLFDGEITKNIIVSNGKYKWNYIPSLNIVLKDDIKFEQKLQKQYGIFLDYLDESTLSYLGEEILNGEQVYIFEGRVSKIFLPKHPNGPFRIKAYFGVKDGIIRKIATYSRENNELDSQVFYNLKIGIELDDSIFIFEPPVGAKVIDATIKEEAFQEMQKNRQE